MDRIKRLSQMLPEDIDAALITSGVNRQYYTGFVSSAGALLVTREKAVLLRPEEGGHGDKLDRGALLPHRRAAGAGTDQTGALAEGDDQHDLRDRGQERIQAVP